MTTARPGREVLVDALLAEGVRYCFGNPGTTELPLIEAIERTPGIDYVLALHEAVAVGAADGYAHASGEVGFANVHVAPGLGNALGALYNAWEGHTPLVLTAGQQDTRLRLREPLLGHDLVAMAAPLTKWSVEVRGADEIAPVMARAFALARAAPSGPVFVALPIDVMDQPSTIGAWPRGAVHARTRPDPGGVREAAALLARAARPAVVCGDEVARSPGAVAALIELVERLGAEVWGEVLPAHVSFPNRHPAWRGRLPADAAAIGERLAAADVVVLAGGDFFEEVWFEPATPFAPGAILIELQAEAASLGRNYPVRCALAGDLGETLRALAGALEAGLARPAASPPRGEPGAARRAPPPAEQAADDRLTSAALAAAVGASLPPGAVVASEAITATPDLLRSLDLRHPGELIASRGGGIGQGLPSALGIKLACPDRAVLAISGDGSAMYTIQALWSAAHHRIAVVFLILANRRYRILELNLDRYRARAGLDAATGYPQLGLADPSIDFVEVARGLGVEGCRAESRAALGEALSEAFAAGGPRLIEAHIP